MNAPFDPDQSLWIALDGGTTRTRAWLLEGGRMLARVVAPFGARDATHAQAPEPAHQAVRRLLMELLSAQPGARPAFIAVAGMLTSGLGLAEVPHVPAPAALEDLAAGARRFVFPDVFPAPFWLFPGVRCGGPECDDVNQTDVMRGEETLCVGLLQSGRAPPPFALLHLGSHWKWIEVDAAGRIAFCRTTLSGELLQAARTSTVLASALPEDAPANLDGHWCERGMSRAREAGLSRALFCARLLELQGRAGAPERLAFALGALVASDQKALLGSTRLPPDAPTWVEGWPAAAEAWLQVLKASGRNVLRLEEEERDRAFLDGLRALLRRVTG